MDLLASLPTRSSPRAYNLTLPKFCTNAPTCGGDGTWRGSCHERVLACCMKRETEAVAVHITHWKKKKHIGTGKSTETHALHQMHFVLQSVPHLPPPFMCSQGTREAPRGTRLRAMGNRREKKCCHDPWERRDEALELWGTNEHVIERED